MLNFTTNPKSVQVVELLHRKVCGRVFLKTPGSTSSRRNSWTPGARIAQSGRHDLGRVEDLALIPEREVTSWCPNMARIEIRRNGQTKSTKVVPCSGTLRNVHRMQTVPVNVCIEQGCWICAPPRAARRKCPEKRWRAQVMWRTNSNEFVAIFR